jgi:regulator of replication initiation timing
MRNTKIAGQRPSTTHLPTQPQPAKLTPAVPISIYRELSTDLQATKESMAALQRQNQQLTEQNQLLRQELERIANRTQKAVQHLDSLQANPPKPVPKRKKQPEIAPDMLVEDYIEELPIVPEQYYRTIPDFAPEPQMTQGFNVPEQGFQLPNLPKPKLVYEQSIQRLNNWSEASGDMPTWKMSAVIALIICSAFGAGFLIVRPLLSPSR